MYGICTLGNDKVYDQIIALLNSIEAIYGQEMPICIYPYDDNTARITAEIAHRPQVQIYNNQDSIRKWDEFVRQIWDAHPTAQKHWLEIGSGQYHRVGTHRRFCAFDGPFDKFVYMDADTLLMSPLEQVFAGLNNHDWVVYDFQYKDLSHVYDASATKLKEIFPTARLQEIFCSGFYASKKGVFDEHKQELLTKLQQGEAEILYDMAPDQTILNYMVMRSAISSYNFAHHLNASESTGCCVTSTHFENRDNILYDRNNRLTYIHYIGLSSKLFSRVVTGENIAFPYRDIFLHYRFLHEPDKRPQFRGQPKVNNGSPNIARRILAKLLAKLKFIN